MTLSMHACGLMPTRNDATTGMRIRDSQACFQPRDIQKSIDRPGPAPQTRKLRDGRTTRSP